MVLVAECCLLSLLKKFWIGRRPLTGRRELHRSSVAGSGRKYEAEKVSDYMGGQGRPGEGGSGTRRSTKVSAYPSPSLPLSSAKKKLMCDLADSREREREDGWFVPRTSSFPARARGWAAARRPSQVRSALPPSLPSPNQRLRLEAVQTGKSWTLRDDVKGRAVDSSSCRGGRS